MRSNHIQVLKLSKVKISCVKSYFLHGKRNFEKDPKIQSPLFQSPLVLIVGSDYKNAFFKAFLIDLTDFLDKKGLKVENNYFPIIQ